MIKVNFLLLLYDFMGHLEHYPVFILCNLHSMIFLWQRERMMALKALLRSAHITSIHLTVTKLEVPWGGKYRTLPGGEQQITENNNIIHHTISSSAFCLNVYFVQRYCSSQTHQRIAYSSFKSNFLCGLSKILLFFLIKKCF